MAHKGWKYRKEIIGCTNSQCKCTEEEWCKVCIHTGCDCGCCENATY